MTLFTQQPFVPDRPFKDRPYGRVRLDEPSLYDLHAVLSEWARAARQVLDASPHGSRPDLERQLRRVERVRESLVCLADEKDWNVPVAP